MKRYRTFRKAYDHFGARPTNPRSCWSGKSPDGNVVVLTFWDAKRQWDGRLYNLHGEVRYPDGKIHPWVLLPGNRLRKLDIEQALIGNCGKVRGLLVRPTNPNAKRYEWLVRDKAADIVALDGWYRIEDYDPETGAFKAELMA